MDGGLLPSCRASLVDVPAPTLHWGRSLFTAATRH